MRVDTNNLVILDVRTTEEHQASSISNSINMDILSSDFFRKAEFLDKDKRYLIYSRDITTADRAALILYNLGFTNNIYGVNAPYNDFYLSSR